MSRSPIRYRVVALSDTSCRVTLPSTWDIDNPSETFEVFVPANGGYVRRWLPNGDAKQICDKLYDSGSTLSWYPNARLSFAEFIRREVRRRKRSDARDDAR